MQLIQGWTNLVDNFEVREVGVRIVEINSILFQESTIYFTFHESRETSNSLGFVSKTLGQQKLTFFLQRLHY